MSLAFLKHSINQHILLKTFSGFPTHLGQNSNSLPKPLYIIFPAHLSTLSLTRHPSLYSPHQLISLGNSIKHCRLVPATGSLYCRDFCLELPSTLGCVCLSPLAQTEAVSEYPFYSRHSKIPALALFFLPSTHHEAHIIHHLDYFLIICLPQLEGKFQIIRVFVCLVCPYPKCPFIE